MSVGTQCPGLAGGHVLGRSLGLLLSFLCRWRMQAVTLTAWTKREGNGLLGTLSTSLAVSSLQEPGCWEPVVALGMAVEDKGGRCGQCARAATQLCRVQEAL